MPHHSTRLKDLMFSDMYIAADPSISSQHEVVYFRPTPVIGSDERGVQPLPESYAHDISSLRKMLSKYHAKEFRIVYDDVLYRVAVLPDINAPWYILRRGFSVLPALSDLGMKPIVADRLLKLGQGYGLILVAGAMGSGKTTTCSSLFCEYLSHYGNVGVTVEDPAELPLSGLVGKGICYQIEVDHDDWETPLKKVFRFAARYLFVGEIRTPAAATQALRAAARGLLVVATVHANNIVDGLHVVKVLAASQEGEEVALMMLAETIKAIMVTSLNPRLEVTSLFAENNAADPLGIMIRDGKFSQIGTLIQQQEALVARQEKEEKMRAMTNVTTTKQR
ncbi:MAG: ATPase, T2SS/T4P/T4SS family [Alphaproteobacteria bacterium]